MSNLISVKGHLFMLEKGDPRVGNSVGGYHSNETRVEHPAIGYAENGKLKKDR